MKLSLHNLIDLFKINASNSRRLHPSTLKSARVGLIQVTWKIKKQVSSSKRMKNSKELIGRNRELDRNFFDIK